MSPNLLIEKLDTNYSVSGFCFTALRFYSGHSKVVPPIPLLTILEDEPNLSLNKRTNIF